MKAALAGRNVLATKRMAVFVSTLIAFAARPSFAQTNGQLWGNITLDWVRSDKLTFELDVEPKVLVAAALNKANLTEDGAGYLIADWEWFIPLSDPTERFANRQRIRSGLGYRRNVKWRFEALYIWSRSRDTTDEGFKTSDHILDLRLKRVF